MEEERKEGRKGRKESLVFFKAITLFLGGREVTETHSLFRLLFALSPSAFFLALLQPWQIY